MPAGGGPRADCRSGLLQRPGAAAVSASLRWDAQEVCGEALEVWADSPARDQVAPPHPASTHEPGWLAAFASQVHATSSGSSLLSGRGVLFGIMECSKTHGSKITRHSQAAHCTFNALPICHSARLQSAVHGARAQDPHSTSGSRVAAAGGRQATEDCARRWLGGRCSFCCSCCSCCRRRAARRCCRCCHSAS